MDLVVGRSALRSPPLLALEPRPGGGVRLMTRLSPTDDVRYRRLVARVAAAIERSLTPVVMANRVAGASLELEDWRTAHARWRRATGPSRERGLRVSLDVASCYDSIRPEVVASALVEVGADPRDLERLLLELADHGVPGLPIGPDASAVLANVVLRGVDRALMAGGVPHVRWVDDVVAFVPGQRQAVRVADLVRLELERLGLRVNEDKSRIEDARTTGRGAASQLERATHDRTSPASPGPSGVR